MHNIGSVLKHALRELKYDTKIKERLVLEVWGEVVGKHIAGQTQPEDARNGKLFVRVSTPAWMRELESMKQIIIDCLNTKIEKGVIKELHFSLGEISPPEVPKAMAPDGRFTGVEVEGDCLESIERALLYITDPQIREVLSPIMIKDAKLRKFRGG